MGLYALYGGVVVAVSRVVLGVVGEGSGGLAGCNKGEEKQEEERDSNGITMFVNKRIEITQSRYKQVLFHFVRWLVVG